jgi:hypothetical protein
MNTRLISLLCSLLLLTGCQTTEVLNVWSDDSQGEKFSDVLVIAIFKEPAYRNVVEQRLVEVLQEQGVEAESASILYPHEGPMDQDTVDGMVAQSSADSVMMVRLVDTRKETVYTPGTTYVPGGYGGRYSMGYYGYYGGGYTVMSTPGYSTEYDISTLETTVFSTASNNRVWSTITETTETSVNKAINSYIKVIGKTISESGLF